MLTALDGATAWLNSPPLTSAGLRGRVVLVDFWTFTCINWLRTAPYLRAWHERFADDGLVVVGVHTPEFDVEHDLAEVRRSVTDLRVDYPVAVDNDYAIWRGFDNQYWPALYLVDAAGRIRHHWFGEGDYDRTEQHIRQLLQETGAGARGPVVVDARGAEAPADWDNLRSPETYLGSARSERFAPPGSELRLNRWTLSGDWTIQRQAAVLDGPPGRIAYRFSARDVHLVMGATGETVPFEVRLDGEPPAASAGLDVDADGRGTVSHPRLYQLVRQAGPVTERTFEITFLGGGVHANVFTFG